jgi:hypothetical protein
VDKPHKKLYKISWLKGREGSTPSRPTILLISV